LVRKTALSISLLAVACGCLWANDTPRLEPLLGLPPHPADNPATPEKIKLGEMLFFETMLSNRNQRSCSTCHKPELFFTDGFSRAWGLHETELPRKTPNLLNVGWQRSMFFDGRAKTLEEQVRMPLENHQEMDLDPEVAAKRLAADPLYSAAFAKVFPGETISFALVAKAIASYERTLVSYDSDVDRYLAGDREALNPQARRGLDLFTGRAGCIRCHNGPMLTDHQFHYTGVPERDGDKPAGTKYKTQSLRDVARRFSFMHNGHYLRLDHVIDHYNRGGSAPGGAEAEIRPLSLSNEEKSDLTAFLRSLNGRIDEALGQSAASADLFSVPRPIDHDDRSSQTGPVTDPAYQKAKGAGGSQPAGAKPAPQAEGPVQDPADQRPKRP
jgi:cytochrome c peroxidase